ncbi:MAG: tetratricopeptide repeat protein [Chitinophagaceae bacterium]
MDRLEKLKLFIAQNPQDHFSKHALAMEYVKLGDDQAAKALLESILKADPGYIGSYYHLGKLLERSGNTENAKMVYMSGIEIARKQGDNHARGELITALDNLD